MNRILAFAFALALAGLSPLAGETVAERKGKQVIDAALEAMGGGRFLAMRDRVESGRVYSFYHERLSGLSLAKVYTRYLIRPEPPVPGFLGVREREAFGKKEDSYVLFTEGKGYEVNFHGARPLPDEQVARFKDSTLHNIFYILRQRMGEPGLIMESHGSDFFDNQPCDVVNITDADNRVTTVYFNQDTKLPTRQIYYRRNAQTRDKDEEETLFSKYRNVNGVMWPYTIRRQRNGEKTFEIYSDNVQINADLKDDLFTLPGNIKILKKAK